MASPRRLFLFSLVLLLAGSTCACGSTGSTNDESDANTTSSEPGASDVDEGQGNQDSISTSEPEADAGDSADPDALTCKSDDDCLSLVDSPCEIARCEASSGLCELEALSNYTPCDDGDSCTLDEVCFEGACSRGVQRICDDANPCTSDACDQDTGCVFEDNDAPCDDGNACTVSDQCSGGACEGTTTDSCSCTEDADCNDADDDNLCNGSLVCADNQCVVDPATVVVCEDAQGSPCTVSTCDPATGLCALNPLSDIPCSDGNACTEGDTCVSGVCEGTPAPCECEADSDCAAFDDDDLCNGVMACVEGTCKTAPETVVDCSAGSVEALCQVSACEPSSGECVVLDKPDGTPCSLPTACIEKSACLSGVCQGTPVVCDDGNPCTDDSCSEEDEGCIFVNNTLPCDDGDACTTSDQCSDGACSSGEALLCEDDDPCTDDQCDPQTGCVSTPLSCEDDDPCTLDGCVDGECVHTPDTSLAACTACTDDSACDDGLPCTDESCDLESGLCITADKVCDDDNPCTSDTCNDAGECEFTPVDGAICDDGDPCTSADTCEGGLCAGTADPACLGCGDGTCGAGENCASCPQDCEPCTGVCCEDNGSAGCDDPEVMACVCALDDMCCMGTWDAACAQAAEACGAECASTACCEVSEGAGCDDEDIAACVCSEDSFCCDTEWDEYCVEAAVLGCGATCATCGDGACALGEDCETCPEDCGACPECGDDVCAESENCGTCPSDCGGPCAEGACCEANGTPGCEDPTVNACVCAIDASCCEVSYDALCVLFAVEYCGESAACQFECGDEICDAGETCESCSEDCGSCETCGDGACTSGEHCAKCPEDCGACSGSCCEAHSGAGCDDADVALCVCDIVDPWCCEIEWDDLCVAAATDGCGACSSPPGSGPCCEAHEGLGCSDPEISACVCEAEPFCCEGKWDEFCAEAAGACGATCPAACGDGVCAANEGCGGCPEDCGLCAGPCCAAHPGVGCADAATSACVCASNPSCCADKWTEACATQAVLQCGWTEDCATLCGDDLCELGETCSSCESDCGACGVCGDESCGPSESCTSCPEDCGLCTGPCCDAHDGAGCEDSEVSDCVCEGDLWCCELAWDELCVASAKEVCGACEEPTEPLCGDTTCAPQESCATCPEDCGTCLGDCCLPHDGPGCAEADVQSCVCESAPYCCETQWDVICAAFAAQQCGAGCVTEPGCGDEECGAEEDCLSCPTDCGVCEGPCNAPSNTPGCENPDCSACVCNEDPFCCEFEWDISCVGYAEGACAAACKGPVCGDDLCAPGEGCENCPDDCGTCSDNACCAPSGDGSPGCNESAVESCVCELLPECCSEDFGWDAQCAGLASGFCAADCDGVPASCCQAHEGLGCEDELTSDWVCVIMPECCTEAWSDACVALAEEAGSCGQGGQCCLGHGGLGCQDAEVEACVCSEPGMDYCCSFVWDEECALIASESCNAGIASGESCVPQSTNDCCATSSEETPGCDTPAIASCVCALEPSCCAESWSALCAELAATQCQAPCGPIDTCGDDVCSSPLGVVHVVTITSEGYDPKELVVAAGDSVTWVNEDSAPHSATSLSGPVPFNIPLFAGQQGTALLPIPGAYSYYDVFDGTQTITGEITVGPAANGETCASCPQDCGPCPGQSEGDCCEPSDAPGCFSAGIESCVCDSDDPQASYCCETAWDSYCVELVLFLGCGDCDIPK